MKILKSNSSRTLPSDSSPCSTTQTEKPSSESIGSTKPTGIPLFYAITKTEHSPSGLCAEHSGYKPENDFRGLDPAFLKVEGDRARFVSLMLCIFAFHMTYLGIALLYAREWVGSAIFCLIALFIWAKTIENARLSWKFLSASKNNSQP